MAPIRKVPNHEVQAARDWLARVEAGQNNVQGYPKAAKQCLGVLNGLIFQAINAEERASRANDLASKHFDAYSAARTSCTCRLKPIAD